MSIEKMREEFEAWARTGIDPLVDGDFRWAASTENYYWASTRAMWESWQASRESLVIELPDYLDTEKLGFPAYDANAVDAAIEAAGLKVKS